MFKSSQRACLKAIVASHDAAVARRYIPWVNTAHLNKGVDTLNRMYLSLESPSMKRFIHGNCAFLLKPLAGNTWVSINMVNPAFLTTHPNTVQLGNKISNSYTARCSNLTGVYAFFNTGPSIHQCGSNLSFSSRMSVHYQEASSSPKFFYADAVKQSGGLSIYLWNPIATTPNYLLDYQRMGHKLTPAEKYILTAFTWQYVRSLEQAVTSYANPTYWKGIDINLWHINWVAGYTLPSIGFLTTWENEKGIVLQARSINLAASRLGISHTSVTRVANCITPYWIMTPNYGLVTITIDEYPSLSAPKFTEPKPFNDKVNYLSLDRNLYYLLDKNFVQLPMGPYKTISLVNDALGLKSDRQNSRWVNRLHLVTAPKLGPLNSVYIVSNAEGSSHPMVLTDIVNDIAYNMPSMSSAIIKMYGNKRGFGNTIRAYVLPRLPVTIRGNTWLLEYANPLHHAHAVIKHSVRKQ